MPFARAWWNRKTASCVKPKTPANRNEEFARLQEADGRVRRQFVQAEVDTCLTSLQMGEFELSTGDLVIAQREVEVVEKGIRTIERFLPALSEGDRGNLGTKLQQVKSELEDLKSNVRLRRARSQHGT
jgi:hypothetical protein